MNQFAQRAIWLVVLIAALLLSGCEFFGLRQLEEPGSQTGTLVVGLAPHLVARTIEPEISMEVDHYVVAGDGPNEDGFTEEPVTTQTLTKSSLVPGEWTITVHAYNDVGTEIGAGTATGTLTAGEILELTVTVDPLPGSGELDLLVSWPAGVLTGLPCPPVWCR